MSEVQLDPAFPIRGYVVAEDRSLAARIDRFRRHWHGRGMRLAVRIRQLHRRAEPFRQIVPALWARLNPARHACRDLLLGLAGLFLLLRHLLRSDRPNSALPKVRRPMRGGLAVVLVMVAFLAALLMPERDGPAALADVNDIGSQPPETVSAAAVIEPVAIAPPLPVPVTLSQPASWQPVRRPISIFHLEAPDLAGLEPQYLAATRGTSRQDTLLWAPRAGASSEARRSLVQIVIERHEGGTPTERPFFADLAARAAEQHLVIGRMARPEDVRTKFGTMEVAEAQFRHDGRDLSCLGFRRIDMAGLTLAGWVCGVPDRPVDRVSFACLINRLDLVGGGRDAGLRRIFSEAERNRIACSSARQPGRRLTWLDHEAPVPGLKLSARGR